MGPYNDSISVSKKKRGRLNYAEETRGELNAKGVVAGDL